jgi:Ca2+-transporting ATPase
LLWINLITDGLPAIALGIDPISPDLMEGPPRRSDDPLLNGSRLRHLLARGAILAAACLGAFAFAHYVWDEPWTHARMTMFATLALSQLAYAFAVRRPRAGGGKAPARFFSNRWLLVGTGGGLVLQFAALSWSPTRDLLGTATLTMREWALVVGAAVLPSTVIVAVEARRPRSARPYGRGADRP